jgi:hypothetical protein
MQQGTKFCKKDYASCFLDEQKIEKAFSFILNSLLSFLHFRPQNLKKEKQLIPRKNYFLKHS